jgi:hypothetical protein
MTARRTAASAILARAGFRAELVDQVVNAGGAVAPDVLFGEACERGQAHGSP